MKPPSNRKYLILLLSLILLVVVVPAFRGVSEARLILDLFVSLVFVISLQVIVRGGRLKLLAFALGIPTMFGLWTGYFIPGTHHGTVVVVTHLLGAAFFSLMITVVLRDVHQLEGISPDSVYGAFCGYLFAGLVFGHIYAVFDLLTPGAFRGDAFAEPISPDRRHLLLMYFSFITLTTVGYGDIIPGTDAVRGLVIAEAVTGQFYIAVLVAELIGKRVSQPPTAAVPQVPPNQPQNP